MKNPIVVLGSIVSLLSPALQAQQPRREFSGPPQASIEEPFSQIGPLRLFDADRGIVVDRTERTVTLIDFRTGRRQAIGRAGEGPGEYRYPRSVVAAANGNSWLYDASLARLLLVDPQGRITSSRSVPSIPSGARELVGTDAKGALYFVGNEFDRERGSFADSVVVVRWDPGTDMQQTLRRVWSGGRVVVTRPSGPASFARGVTPFPHVDHWVVLPDGKFVMIKHEPYQVEVTDPTGATRPGPVIATTPVPVSARDRAEYREANANRTAGALMVGGGTGPMRQAMEFRDEEFPAHKPTVMHQHVLAAANGEIWIGRSQPAAAIGTIYDVLASDGRKLREVRFADNVRVVAATVTAVYVARTELDTGLMYLERHAQ